MKLGRGKGLKEPIRLTDADDSGPAEICDRIRGHAPDQQFVRELRPAGGAGQLRTPVAVRPVQLDEVRPGRSSRHEEQGEGDQEPGRHVHAE